VQTCGYCGASVDKLALGRRCYGCERTRKSEWARENKERLRVRGAELRALNRDKLRSSQAAYRAEHAEEIREYHRRWRVAHGRGGLGHVSGPDHPKFKHGLSKTREHMAWRNAVERCTNEHSDQWHNYGGRGITMCPEWLASFEAFFTHIGPCPSPRHQLDRIHNDGNYEPGNVRWATRRAQSHNKRATKLTEDQVEQVYERACRGERTTDLAKEFGVSPSYVSHIKRRHARP